MHVRRLKRPRDGSRNRGAKLSAFGSPRIDERQDGEAGHGRGHSSPRSWRAAIASQRHVRGAGHPQNQLLCGSPQQRQLTTWSTALGTGGGAGPNLTAALRWLLVGARTIHACPLLKSLARAFRLALLIAAPRAAAPAAIDQAVAGVPLLVLSAAVGHFHLLHVTSGHAMAPAILADPATKLPRASAMRRRTSIKANATPCSIIVERRLTAEPKKTSPPEPEVEALRTLPVGRR